VAEALDRGVAEARKLRRRDLIEGAALSLQGQWRLEQSMLDDAALVAGGPASLGSHPGSFM
jgi:hypothetical protein